MKKSLARVSSPSKMKGFPFHNRTTANREFLPPRSSRLNFWVSAMSRPISISSEITRERREGDDEDKITTALEEGRGERTSEQEEGNRQHGESSSNSAKAEQQQKRRKTLNFVSLITSTDVVFNYFVLTASREREWENVDRRSNTIFWK